MRSGSSGTRVDRGQTSLDFLVGVSIFLLTIAFVIAFVAQLTAPYQAQEKPVVAERVASDLTESYLAESGTPSALDEDCTVAFFSQAGGEHCSFEPTDTLHEQLGLSSRYAVNVTLSRGVTEEGSPALLCATNGTIGACGSNSLAIGEPVPDRSRSAATAKRTVHVGGMDAVLEVTVW